jgi:hypothetical protein
MAGSRGSPTRACVPWPCSPSWKRYRYRLGVRRGDPRIPADEDDSRTVAGHGGEVHHDSAFSVGQLRAPRPRLLSL